MQEFQQICSIKEFFWRRPIVDRRTELNLTFQREKYSSSSALLRCDYFFDASHKLRDVGALLDALAFLQVLECRLELGLRDCGAGEAH